MAKKKAKLKRRPWLVEGGKWETSPVEIYEGSSW